MYTKAQHLAQRMVHESLNLKSWLVAATLYEETREWSELMEISDSEEDTKFERSENYEKATEPKRSRSLGKKKIHTRNKKQEGLSDQLGTFLIGTDAKDVETGRLMKKATWSTSNCSSISLNTALLSESCRQGSSTLSSP